MKKKKKPQFGINLLTDFDEYWRKLCILRFRFDDCRLILKKLKLMRKSIKASKQKMLQFRTNLLIEFDEYSRKGFLSRNSKSLKLLKLIIRKIKNNGKNPAI